MNTLSKDIDEVLVKLENAVEHDVLMRQQGRTGKSPKSIHEEATKAINKLILEFIKDLCGDEIKPHSEPKLGIDTPTYLTANEYSKNAYRKELLELAENKLADRSNQSE